MPAGLRHNGNDDEVIPFAPGSPMQKFFQQFGDQKGQGDAAASPPDGHRRRLGFLHLG